MRIAAEPGRAIHDIKEFLCHAQKGTGGTDKSVDINSHWRDIQHRENSS
jgi:hypothetical protein